LPRSISSINKLEIILSSKISYLTREFDPPPFSETAFAFVGADGVCMILNPIRLGSFRETISPAWYMNMKGHIDFFVPHSFLNIDEPRQPQAAISHAADSCQRRNVDYVHRKWLRNCPLITILFPLFIYCSDWDFQKD
jgi:hypothetical protein